MSEPARHGLQVALSGRGQTDPAGDRRVWTVGLPGPCGPLHLSQDDPMRTDVNPDRPRGRCLRPAATGGLVFAVLFIVQRLLWAIGPDGSAPGGRGGLLC
jgi:hypothetical protein